MAYRDLGEALEDYGKRIVSVERQLSRTRRGGMQSIGDLGGLPRNVDLTSVAKMSVSGAGAANWSNSDLTFSRIGSEVFVNGTLRRISTSSGPLNALGLGYITGPYTPAAIYGSNGGPYPNSVSLPAVGMNGSDYMIPSVVRIRANGYVDVTTSAAAQNIQVSGSYRASDYPTFNSFDYPQFQGTYFKSFMEGNGMAEGTHFDVTHRYGSDPRLAVLAIHGGSGEAGAQEAAIRLADIMGSSLYYLDMRDGFYQETHASSNGFDDPRAVPLVRAANRCISLHGATDLTEWGTGAYSYVGGADFAFRKAIITKLESLGFPCVDAAENIPSLGGTRANNICNLGPNAGVQIEMSTTMRRSLFVGNNLSRINRDQPSAQMEAYCQALADVARDFIAS